MIIASCGHKVYKLEDLIPVEYDDYDCDAIEGFQEVTIYAVYCPTCAKEIKE